MDSVVHLLTIVYVSAGDLRYFSGDGKHRGILQAMNSLIEILDEGIFMAKTVGVLSVDGRMKSSAFSRTRFACCWACSARQALSLAGSFGPQGSHGGHFHKLHRLRVQLLRRWSCLSSLWWQVPSGVAAVASEPESLLSVCSLG